MSDIINKIRYNGTDYDITNGETYSTDEQVIGTWIDGKPIYRKSFSATKVSGTKLVISAGISNYNNLIKLNGVVMSALDYSYPIPVYENSTGYINCAYNKTTNEIQISSADGNYFNGEVNIIIEYTKTTD